MIAAAAPGLLLDKLAADLPEKRIEEAFADQDAEFAEEEDCIYTPAITLWAFLSQVLFKDEQQSCLAAVSRVLALLAASRLRRSTASMP